MESTDRELVEAACRGDVASFCRLYERHYSLAIAIAKSRLADSHLAEDAAQESFAVACRTLSSLRDGNQFASWLATIVRRAANRLTRWRTRRTASVNEYPDLSHSNGDEPCLARVRQAVERLPASGREVIWLHYFGGLSYEQISQALGISLPSVHGRLQRAHRALAHDLEIEND